MLFQILYFVDQFENFFSKVIDKKGVIIIGEKAKLFLVLQEVIIRKLKDKIKNRCHLKCI